MKTILSGKAGLPPGTLVHIGTQKADEVTISAIDYNFNAFIKEEDLHASACAKYKSVDTNTWINVNGLHQVDTLSVIGEVFSLHPLLLEDILNTNHRPKFEEFEEYVFVTLKMIGIHENNESLVYEQLSLILGKSWLISFQEQPGDIFSGLRERMEINKGPIRKNGIDYLFYRLIDTVVDYYFLVIEHFSERIAKLEEKVIQTPNETVLREIQVYKRHLMEFKKSVMPLREILSELMKDEVKFIKKSTVRYLADVYDHIVQVNEMVDVQRDILSSTMDLYQSGISNKTNQVMQVLTIIATIFIPLTFIAGIYGMNFENMPELGWKYGYFAIWGLMILICIIMLIYFRSKKWL
jgi:magnesium transporter